MTDSKPPPVPPLVFWSVWVVMLVGVLVVGSLFLNPEAGGQMPWLVSLGPLFLGLLARFLLLPRIPSRRRAFPIFIIGISMCEMCAILGVFVAQENQQTLLLLGLLGIVTYMPTFLRRMED